MLLLGNAMNADTARGNAVGFGVEVLAQLMGVKSADQETTLMHYLVELTAARGVPAAALRSELRRANPNPNPNPNPNSNPNPNPNP